MKYIILISAAMLLAGCPESPQDRPEVSEDCALNYAIAVIDEAESASGLDYKGAEEEACDAAFDAVHLEEDGASDRWHQYHRAAWANPNEGMLEHCGFDNGEEDLEIKAEMLENDQILRFRCIAGCIGHDPDIC